MLALSVVLLAAACNQKEGGSGAESGAAAVDDARLLNARADPGNWMTHGGTYLEQRFSPLEQINDSNVGKLQLTGFFDLDTNRGQEATPIVIDGVMYTTSAWSKVYALDARTGKLLWQYDPKVPGERGFSACCDVVNRGVAVYKGKVYSGTLDGRLIALDAKTGKLVWSKVTVDQSKPYTITGAPRIIKGNVVIGNGGAEYGVRGYVTAYDAESGDQAWRFFTVPGNPAAGPDGAASDKILASARKTWAGEWWKAGGGGTVWDAIVYDPELDLVYLGVGNGSPWNHRLRSAGKGDNLFLSSIVALKPDTGEYVWHYQETPAETWDFTATQPIILADLELDGKQRKVLMHAPKNGFFYVIDRRTGKLISAKNFVETTWATHVDQKTGRPIETPGARYDNKDFLALPAALGAHNWHPMSFSPVTKLVYIPAQEIPFVYGERAGFKYRPGLWNTGVDGAKWGAPDDLGARKAIRAMLKGRLLAWDPVRQKEAWRVEHPGPWNGGILSTAGNLVFQGTSDGYLRAYRADNGKRLWSFPAQTGIVAGPVTYSVGGEQYVAVMAGYGGSYALAIAYHDKPRPAPNGRVLIFKLGGTAKLPEAPKLEFAPPNPPAQAWSAAEVAAGADLFETTCAVCHGSSAVSSGVLPDLRRSGVLTDAAAWRSVVLDGALKDRGMIGFGKYISPQQAEQLRAFVGSKARLLQSQEASGEASRRSN